MKKCNCMINKYQLAMASWKGMLSNSTHVDISVSTPKKMSFQKIVFIQSCLNVQTDILADPWGLRFHILMCLYPSKGKTQRNLPFISNVL